jgi:hypothetical protein
MHIIHINWKNRENDAVKAAFLNSFHADDVF